MIQYHEIVDNYFDITKFDKDTLNYIYKLFKGLIYARHVPESLIIKCCNFGRLQELVDKKLKTDNISSIKKWFIDSKINLDQYLINTVEQNMNFKIYDDDHCPNCNSKGYISKNNMINIDCSYCLIHICKKCIANQDKIYHTNKINDIICEKCMNINKKINSNKSYDKKHFNKEGNIDIKYVVHMLNDQDYKCYLCNDDIITMFYKQYCCHQFSIDRIDNLKPHDKNNVRITCYYCNCKHHNKFTQQHKKCDSKCHEEKVITNTIKAFKFSKFTNPTLIEYDINKPIGKIYKSKIAYICGIPLMMDWLNDKKSDNQFATYIVADPVTGISPDEFQSKAGTIILFREDQIELTIDDLDYIWNFFAMLMNYTIYKEIGNETIEFDSWVEMTKYPYKKAWNNIKRVMNESIY